ncbi:hypothetical protein GUITHDRAFT_154432 [Guillardia theta CCMP2712]|uniref:Uncharacterized protein n=1 Tax=Guillardia theta (strain CCMP2712) TaxID=905079 RepID=L1IUH2_GUITC|nr:hypothetical protein GUITHDRAFT_154432 [Guillardia theta CCMP2712]EKX39490.1 hypothetical protein GUITHDRAFT_154432 [Guillardia theta CCMP2712]|eukprot:XP_005826470.1 hypothetical protein GUITHDRAFT_154432 [Guillardia theta CCMP2712]
MASALVMVVLAQLGESATSSLKMEAPEESMKHRFETVKAKHIARQHGVSAETLKKDAENQQHIARSHHSDVEAASMSPHLSMHSTRGQEAGRGMRGRRGKFQQSAYGAQKLPPDEATPFFDTYVLHYAFPTIAIICTCLACVLLRTMKMYQKERWKGTSYFHGARRSAESLLPGLK